MKTKLQIGLLAFFSAFLVFLLVMFGGQAIDLHPLVRYELAFAAYFLLSYYLIKRYKDKFSPIVLLILILLGTMIYQLPYILTHLPFHYISLTGLWTYLLGSVFGYGFALAKTKTVKSLVIVIALVYAVIYALIYPDLFVYFQSFWM